MSKRRLNATAASLLGFLHWGPMSGWDLVATAQHVIGDFWSLTRSQVYRELAWMAEAGLIEAGERGSRERQPYTLTAAGRAAFASWADDEPGPETIRFPLLLKISFGRYVPPDQLASFIRRHHDVHARRLAEYEQHLTLPEETAEPRDAYREATFAFGIAYERAVLAWFDSLPPDIRGPRDSQEERPRPKPRRRRASRSGTRPPPQSRMTE